MLRRAGPNLVQNHNVILDNRSSAGKSGDGPLNNRYPNDFIAVNQAAVGWTDAANANYALAGNSPYKGQASDGTDPGVNMDRAPGCFVGIISDGNADAHTHAGSLADTDTGNQSHTNANSLADTDTGNQSHTDANSHSHCNAHASGVSYSYTRCERRHGLGRRCITCWISTFRRQRGLELGQYGTRSLLRFPWPPVFDRIRNTSSHVLRSNHSLDY